HLRPDADPEPENEQRGERDGRRGVESRDPRLQHAFHGGAFGHGKADHHAKHARDRVAERELDRADRHVLPQLAAFRERRDRGEDLRGSGEKQRVGDEKAAHHLPQQQSAQDRHSPAPTPASKRRATLTPQPGRASAPPCTACASPPLILRKIPSRLPYKPPPCRCASHERAPTQSLSWVTPGSTKRSRSVEPSMSPRPLSAASSALIFAFETLPVVSKKAFFCRKS